MAVHDPEAFIKGVMLAPAGLVGCITGAILKHAPIKTVQDVATFALMIFALHLPLFAALAFIYLRKRSFFGHSWITWLVLVLVAYGIGFGGSVLL
jgi:hypothetical protein